MKKVRRQTKYFQSFQTNLDSSRMGAVPSQVSLASDDGPRAVVIAVVQPIGVATIVTKSISGRVPSGQIESGRCPPRERFAPV